METIYKLKSGNKLNREHPSTFGIPSDTLKAEVEPGDYVKLIFASREHGVERMWVKVTSRPVATANRPAEAGDPYSGSLANDPFDIPGLQFGDPVTFKAKHIIDITTGKD